MTSDRIIPGTVVDGRFEIERLANGGGMGEVFYARDLRTNAPVAVKVMRTSNPVHLARFEREARALSQFDHPSIVRYVAHGSDPVVFLAMEWLEGEDLSHRLTRGPLSTTEALKLTKGVADALAAAHTRGIIHRDIKPSNIFLCGGRIDAVKVLDFGVAQVVQSTRAITGTGQLLGTFGYMAPEQALSGRDVTPAVDVFSLGCVLFECLTGTAAFAGEFAQMLSKILSSDPPRLRDVKRDAPLALDDLITRMFRRDPAKRVSMTAVSTDIAAFLSAGEIRPGIDLAKTLVPAVTGDERRRMVVVVVDSVITATSGPETDLGTAATISSRGGGLWSVVSKFGGEVDVLPAGLTVITFGAAGGGDILTRAARCALELRDALTDVRIAIASGRGDPSRDGVVGEIVERAQTLIAGAGDPKLVQLDSVTAGLLDSRFKVNGDGATYLLAGERKDDGARRLLGRETPCVGRERDLAMLGALVTECLDEEIATAVVITGNPGVGKSRLRHEVIRVLRDRDDPPEVWTARGDPIAAGSPFGLLGQLLRQAAGLEESERVELRRQKLLARVGRNLPIHDAIRVAEFLGEVVGAEFDEDERPYLRAARQDPAAMTDQLRRAWDELMAAETAAGPIVIVLEDLQWGDLPTIRFIDWALRNQRHRPLLVLSVARPEVHESFPGLFRDRRVHEVRLADLTPAASRRLVLDVLGPNTDPEVVKALVERSHGNPYYLEELIRGVAEGEATLPETVLATAQARLQRLEPGARRLLRAASVLGTSFWVGAVAALLKADGPRDLLPTVESLVEREVLMLQPSSRFRGEDEYVFRHTLVRDAAYEMLTDRDRQQAHALAADWLEASGERDALILAEQFERSDARHRAVVWYLWAAEQALEGNDLVNVLRRAERGVQCGATGAILGELTLLKAEATGWAGIGTHFGLAEAALDLLTPGSSAWTRAAAELVVACRTRGDAERLRATADRVIATPPDSESIGHASARARIAVELLEAGEVERAERIITSIAGGMERAEPTDLPTMRTTLAWLRAAAAQHAGNPQSMVVEAGEIAKAFEAEGNARWVALVALHAAMASAATNDPQAGTPWAERSSELARRLGLTSCEVRARAWLAYHLAESGHLEPALTMARAAVRDAPSDQVAEGDAKSLLAHVALAAGDVDTARAEADDVARRQFPADAKRRVAAVLERLKSGRT